MSSVRFATEQDIPQLLRLCFMFQQEAKDTFKGFSKEITAANMETLIASDGGEILVLESDEGKLVGLLACTTGQFLFNDHTYALELAFFVEQKHRGGTGAIKLLKTYEQWAEDMCVEVVHLADITSVKSHKEMYERLGYIMTESAYSKELN